MAHILRSTAHAALAAEAATGAASAVGAALERAVTRATPILLDVLGRYPTYPRPPTVAGSPLPTGRVTATDSHADHRVWISDDEVADPRGLLSALHDAYPDTGLWPMLWQDSGDTGSGPMEWLFDLPDAPPPSAEEVLHRRWDGVYGSTADPAYADADDCDATFQPWAGGQTPATPGPTDVGDHLPVKRLCSTPGRLVLVPTPRPEDVFLTLGPSAYNDRPTPGETTAVLRSWGDRCGVLPVVSSMDTTELIVRRPPITPSEAYGLGVEHKAFCLDVFTNYDTKDDVIEHMTGALTWDFWVTPTLLGRRLSPQVVGHGLGKRTCACIPSLTAGETLALARTNRAAVVIRCLIACISRKVHWIFGSPTCGIDCAPPPRGAQTSGGRHG